VDKTPGETDGEISQVPIERGGSVIECDSIVAGDRYGILLKEIGKFSKICRVADGKCIAIRLMR